MFGRRVIFVDKEEVFVVSLHQIFLPGIFFQDGRVGFQLVQFLFGDSDLLLVVLLALLQFLQLAPLPEMARDKIPGVEEQDPDGETSRRQQIFVLQPGWDMRQKLHKISATPSKKEKRP
jgi:hypothetical protein